MSMCGSTEENIANKFILIRPVTQHVLFVLCDFLQDGKEVDCIAAIFLFKTALSILV